jgi:hypothetical protein
MGVFGYRMLRVTYDCKAYIVTEGGEIWRTSTLKHWHCEFESHLRRGCLRFFCVYVVLCKQQSCGRVDRPSVCKIHSSRSILMESGPVSRIPEVEGKVASSRRMMWMRDVARQFDDKCIRKFSWKTWNNEAAERHA